MTKTIEYGSHRYTIRQEGAEWRVYERYSDGALDFIEACGSYDEAVAAADRWHNETY